MPGKKQEKERSGGNVSRHYKVYQESKAGGGGWDDSLTGPVVAGRQRQAQQMIALA